MVERDSHRPDFREISYEIINKVGQQPPNVIQIDQNKQTIPASISDNIQIRFLGGFHMPLCQSSCPSHLSSVVQNNAHMGYDTAAARNSYKGLSFSVCQAGVGEGTCIAHYLVFAPAVIKGEYQNRKSRCLC
jgi:hypothetical protein